MLRDVAAIFSEVLGSGAVVADEAGMAGYLTDWSGDHRGMAAAVLRPRSVEHVSRVVHLCREHHLAIIPQGGNTGLVAGAIDGQGRRAVVVSTERMDRIRSVDPVDFTLRADAGCTLQAIREASEAADCLFPLALGAQGSCRIGGNAATNAGGVNVLRYGMARDLILGLEVVLPDGEVWNGFSGLRKDNRGYDLKQIFIGSEGTLGIVTGVEVKLFPRPTSVETAYLGVASFADAMRLFAHARRACSDLMTAFEVIGAECIELARLIHPELNVPVTAPVHILMEVSASGPIDLRSTVETFLASAVGDGLVSGAVLAQSQSQARALWSIREGLVEGQARRGYHVRTDVSVPLSSVPAFVDEARATIAEGFAGWLPQAYGHAGDGNVHFNVLPPVGLNDAQARSTGKSIETVLLALVARFGGSISAEHGIGRSKRDAFWATAAPVHKRLMRSLKVALDPQGLMNPGCLLPAEDAL
ncbi:FAD-binding oxidoreductase [Mesorhizobium sp. L-8-3]|uniref:FAD-binding oxidoreductase n=1 Tax=Mesorhizobium sp. L-8-3 TaxID=2744522 RepID=UPI001928E3EC|nr:FAD-binding oxidoreductase [Mesorhizobium sp. L-8-3]BCH23217.1 FAD-binding protein [Mesorhizobium sp. L-8-3]